MGSRRGGIGVGEGANDRTHCAANREGSACDARRTTNCRIASKATLQDCGLDSSFLRMRRSSMKFSAVMVHRTEPNIIITIESIVQAFLPIEVTSPKRMETEIPH
jgi:hypothetical protein